MDVNRTIIRWGSTTSSLVIQASSWPPIISDPLTRAVDAEWLWESQLTLQIPSASLRPLFHSRSRYLLADTDIHAQSTEHHLCHSQSNPEKRSMRRVESSDKEDGREGERGGGKREREEKGEGEKRKPYQWRCAVKLSPAQPSFILLVACFSRLQAQICQPRQRPSRSLPRPYKLESTGHKRH